MRDLRLQSLSVVRQIAAAALLIATSVWSAWAVDSSHERTRAYLVDQDGHVVKSGFGQCWRIGGWTPALAALDPAGCECDGDDLGNACASGSAVSVDVPPPPAHGALPRPASEKVSLSVELQFDSGRPDLRPEAKQRLTDIARRAQSLALEVVIVVGHADRLEGKQAALRRLGETRGDAVKQFLVANGIAANRIYVESKESTQPLSGQTCDGLAAAKARACLQVDRRVEIEVVGVSRGQTDKSHDSSKTTCRSACQQASDDCWSASNARKTQCEKSGSTARKLCDSKYQDDVSDCSFQRIQCASACD